MPYLDRPDGCRLYHELHGPEDASLLILLEGVGGDIPGWRRNIPHLATEHRVIAYDFRGNGRSGKPDAPVTMGTFWTTRWPCSITSPSHPCTLTASPSEAWPPRRWP